MIFDLISNRSSALHVWYNKDKTKINKIEWNDRVFEEIEPHYWKHIVINDEDKGVCLYFSLWWDIETGYPILNNKDEVEVTLFFDFTGFVEELPFNFSGSVVLEDDDE